MSKVVLNETACFGCGFCCGSCPEHFDFDSEENHAKVIDDTVDDSNKKTIEDVAQGCPAGCIEIKEDNEE